MNQCSQSFIPNLNFALHLQTPKGQSYKTFFVVMYFLYWTYINIGNRYFIHNTSFSSLLMNGANKLECYITQVSTGLPRTRSLVYWALFNYEEKEVFQIRPQMSWSNMCKQGQSLPEKTYSKIWLVNVKKFYLLTFITNKL